MDIKSFFTSWKFDPKTSFFTILVLPIVVGVFTILKRHFKAWSNYLVEGVMYSLSRVLTRSLAGRLSLKRYCRLRLAEENRYLYVPSRMEIKLDIDNVYVPLTLENQGGQSYDHRNVLEAGNRLRVIGDPGSGKSSLVKRLFRDACQQVLKKPRNARLPILVELKNLKIANSVPDKKLGDWLFDRLCAACEESNVYEMAKCFTACAQSSGLLVLLDGLDEVSSEAYPRVQKAILGLSNRLAQLSERTTVVLTMRTQFHQQVTHLYRDAFGQALYLAPFAPSDIYEFLTRWPFTSKSYENIARIYGELTDRPTLREMCSNPLVLAMYVAEDQTAGHVVAPDSRTEFYKKVTDELIVKRRLQQTGAVPAYTKLREQRESILGKLAYSHLLDIAQPANSLFWGDALNTTKDVLRCKEADSAVKFREVAKETGLVSEERSEQNFRFIHLTFCEFLAAIEAVQGQSGGWARLINAHKTFQQNKSRPEARTRLIEVIPFAAGLLPRVHRPAAIADVSALGDHGLLARCFLETKLYDHAAWPKFVEAQRQSLLKTPESEWDDRWLRDLHLFNVVVRDAIQCSAHTANVSASVNLDDFFATLIGKQKESLMKLLSAYARQDAAAALRLTEASNLDLLENFPEIVMQHCDQPPFVALLLQKASEVSDRMELLACLIGEAALRTKAVGKRLAQTEPSPTLTGYISQIPKKERWFRKPIVKENLLTQLLTIGLPSNSFRSDRFPLLAVLKKFGAPGACLWRPYMIAVWFILITPVAIFILERCGMGDLLPTVFHESKNRWYFILIWAYVGFMPVVSRAAFVGRSYELLIADDGLYRRPGQSMPVSANFLMYRLFSPRRARKTTAALLTMDEIRKGANH